MPRKATARCIDPFGGVSQSTLEHETRYVLREIEDLQIGSRDDLRQRVEQRNKLCAEADAEFRELLRTLPEPQRLALTAVVLRDVLVAIKLGTTTLLRRMTDRMQPASSVEPVEPIHEPVPLTFSSSLFE
jgi:hypothetical protein